MEAENLRKILKENGEKIAKYIEDEFPQGFKLYFDYDERINGKMIAEAMEIKEDYGSIKDALYQVVKDYSLGQREDAETEVCDTVKEWLEDFCGINCEELGLEEEKREIINEFAVEHTAIDESAINELIENSNIDEVTIAVTPEDEIEDAFYDLSHYGNDAYEGGVNPYKISREGIKEFEKFQDEKPDTINWLVQTQGYNLSDLYDEKKVEKSTFLSSLVEEICDYTDTLDGCCLVFSAMKPQFSSVQAALDGGNVKIEPGSCHVGFSDLCNGSSSGLEIRLERPLVIPSEWKKVKFAGDGKGYCSVSEIFGRSLPSEANFFKATDEKAVPVSPCKNLKDVLKSGRTR